MTARTSFAVLLLALAAHPAPAQAQSADELAAAFRGLLVRNVPEPLIEKSLDWGKQRPAGINGRRGLQNDGHWRRVTVTADNPAHTLLLSVSNVQTQPGRTTFDAYLVGPVDVKFEQQIWKGGLRLYSGETRARLRAKLALKCESTARTEPTGGLLPDV